MTATLRFILAVAAVSMRPGFAWAAPHAFVGGTALIEAEDFTTHLPRDGHEWVVTNSAPGFMAAGYVEAVPNAGTNLNVAWTNSSPELHYEVAFPTSGAYTVWLRGFALGSSDNSVHAGLNGQTGDASHITVETFNTWTWTNRASNGTVAVLNVATAGTQTLNLWMREDGFRIDEIVLTTQPALVPQIGNAWHIPASLEPATGPTMRNPLTDIFPGSDVTLYSGNQYQGDGNAGNQLQSGSALFYRHATGSTWSTLPLFFHATSGNNIHYSNAIPANTFQPGDVVQYYLRIPYSDRLTTYLYFSGGVSRATATEPLAQAYPFSFTVLDPPPPGHPSPADWRDENIYFIFTDRFFDGDPGNNNANAQSPYNPTNSRRIHGGDFRGIEKKLDYIQALGASALWITPIPQNVGNSGYHGYGADNFYQVQPNWGALADLSNLTAAAHARGIRVILDVVCNHQGNRIDSSNPAWTTTYNPNGYPPRWTTGTQHPTPFNQLTNFHNNGHIKSFTDPEQMLGELSGLDDLRTETTYVRTNMLDIYQHWIATADLDGFRLDTVKHVDIGFWQFFNSGIRGFAAAIGKTNFFQFGEIFDGNDAKCGYYTGTKAGGAAANDSVVDYPLYFKVNDVFARALGNTKQIEDRYNGIPANYDPVAQMRLVTFLDNHDQTRFMSSNNANNNTNRLAVALTFLYSSRGIPCLYYGTEQNFNGGGDPNNREDMFDGLFEQGPSLGDNFDMSEGTFLHVAKLNNFRRLYPSLRRGSHVNLWNNPNGPGLFAYARRLGGEEVFVAFNTASSSATLPSRPTSYPAGTRLVNLLNTNETITVVAGADGIPSLNVPATSAKMFIADSLWQPLDPQVIGQSPSHGATNVPPCSTITLEFSKPMDTGSVQNAFTVRPAVGGSFAWSPDHTVVTFTPHPPGMAVLAVHTVRVAAAMDGVSGHSLYSPFETTFLTATSLCADGNAPTVTIAQPDPDEVVAGPLQVAGTASDDVAVESVEVRLDNGAWVAVTGATMWAFTFDSAHFLNGPHALSARATDASGNLSDDASVNIWFFNTPSAYVQRISPGNPNDTTNCDGQVWMKDRAYSFGSLGFSGGSSGVVANAISGVCMEAQSLYQRERYSTPDSSFDYLFDCPDGIYEVTLLQAETWVTGANQRVFDLYIEGERVLTNFDIFAAAGGMNMPITLVFTAEVVDAQIEMHFLPRDLDNARASGIQVRKVGDVDSDGDGTPDWWMLGHYGHATGQEADESLAHQDSDVDGLMNVEEFLADTLPKNNTSLVEIVTFTNELGHAIGFGSSSQRWYAIEYQDVPDFLPGWSNLQERVPGTGGAMSITDTNEAGNRWYRLNVSLP